MGENPQNLGGPERMSRIEEIRTQLEDVADDTVGEFKASVIRELLAEVDALAGRAWRHGYYTGKRDYAGSITGGLPITTPNPYEHRP